MYKGTKVRYTTTKISETTDIKAIKRGILANYVHSIESLVTHKMIQHPSVPG